MFRPISFDSIKKQASTTSDSDGSNEQKVFKPIAKVAAPNVPIDSQLPQGVITPKSENGLHEQLDDTAENFLTPNGSFPKLRLEDTSCDKIEMELLSSSELGSGGLGQKGMWSHNQSFPSDKYGPEAVERDIRRLKHRKSKSAYSPLAIETAESLKPPSFRRKRSSAISEMSSHAVSFSDCPTITSIQTESNNISSRDSGILQFSQIPRHSKELHNSVHEDDRQQSLKRVDGSGPKQRQFSAHSDRSGSSQGTRNSYGSANFRDFVTSRREKSLAQVDIKDKRHASSSSSSTVEHEERAGAAKKLAHRLNSNEGVMRSLRLFERKTDESTGEDDVNPWFQHQLPSVEEGLMLENEYEGSHEMGGKESLGRKKRLKNKIMKFRKDPKFRPLGKSLNSGESSSSEPLLTSNPGSDEGFSISTDFQYDCESEVCYVDGDLQAAIADSKTLEEVLDIAIKLKDRPSEETANLLYKFLATSSMLPLAMELILGYVAEGFELDSTRPLRRNRYDSYREVLVHFFVTGPKKLRKALLANTKAKGLLFSFFVEEVDFGTTKSRKLELNSFRTHSAARILNALLSDNPADVTEHLASKKGLLHTIVRNHIHVPEVIAFVCRLCVGDALSETAGDGHRYGSPNVPGIILLASEGICNLLVHMFTEASNPKGSVSYEDLRWYIQVMSIGCLLELSKRCTVVPQYTKINCSHSNKTIKAVNSALVNINSFQNRNRVELLLESGLSSVVLDPRSSHSEAVLLGNNSAVYALSFASDLISMVRIASESKSVATRRTIGAVSTNEIEQALLSQMDLMIKLLNAGDSCVLGRLKMAIIKTLGALFASSLDDTRSELIKYKVPDILLCTLKANRECSILHTQILECIATSLRHEDATKLHAAWFDALQKPNGVLEELIGVLEDGNKKSMSNGTEWHCYRSTLIDIGFMLSRFSQNLRRADFRRLFNSDKRYVEFTTQIEQGLSRMEQERQGACGGPKPEGTIVSVLANAESLAALLDDVNAV